MSFKKYSWIVGLFLTVFYSRAQEKYSIYFAVDQAQLSPTEMDSFSRWLHANPDIYVYELVGYCDERGSIAYNDALAKRRIQTIVTLLSTHAITTPKLVQKPVGERMLTSPNHAQNRRVDVLYTKKSNNLIPEVDDKPEPNANKEIEGDVIALELSPEELIVQETEALEAQITQAKAGAIVTIKNMNFEFNSEELVASSQPLLNALLEIMLNYPKLTIEIHGHICCNPDPNDVTLSFRRARKIQRFLVDNGVNPKRVGFKGFGSNKPIYKLPEKNETERAANRRVEILIVHPI